MPVVDKDWLRYKEEERKAVQRIGTGPHSAIEWLLRFIQTDLKSLSEGQWSDLAFEISAFSRGQVPFKTKRSFLKEEIGLSHRMWPTEKKVASSGLLGRKRYKEDYFPPHKTVERLHSTIGEAIDSYRELSFAAIFPKIELSFEVPNPQMFEIGLNAEEKKKRSVLYLNADKLEDTFYFYAALLIAEYGPRIKTCAVCERLFPAVREDQFFCSSKCLNRATQQRFRERKKEKDR